VTRLKLLIVDDHPLFRQGLRMLLQAIDGSMRADEAGDLEQALRGASSGDYDLVLLDLNMPGTHGLTALEALRTFLPAVPLVVVSGEHSPRTVRAAIDGGAIGFIPKSLTPERMVEALRCVLDHRVYLPEEALTGGAARPENLLPELTDRQVEVLRSVVQGKSNKSVARDLGVSSETVKSHLAAAMRALGAHNRTELVYIAAQRGLRLV
jgi:DNA-binding NarL/FixJ family response regulator